MISQREATVIEGLKALKRPLQKLSQMVLRYGRKKTVSFNYKGKVIYPQLFET